MIVETYDSYFQGVCELDIMFNIEQAHMILDEVGPSTTTLVLPP